MTRLVWYLVMPFMLIYLFPASRPFMTALVKPFLLHGVETFNGAAARSGHFVDGFASGCYI